MERKRLLLAVVLAAALVPGIAGGGDDAPSPAPSYFVGTWTGAWPGWRTTSASQDVTVTIRRGKEEGVFPVEYAWGAARAGGDSSQLAGSLKTRGRAEGDRFVFEWRNREGRTVQVTLSRLEEDKVQARLEKSGPMATNERPYNETTLTRKQAGP